MVCLGLKPGAAGWKAQTNPLSYSGTPITKVLWNRLLVGLIRESITIWLTSCLFCLELAGLLKLNEQQFNLFGQILTSHTGGQPYSDTSQYGE